MGLFIQENSGDPAVKVRVFMESSTRYVSPWATGRDLFQS
jgi:hypothetical protein